MSENNQTEIILPATIIVRDLAKSIDTSPIQIIKILMANGVMANINQQIDFDTAAIVASECGYEAVLEAAEEEDLQEIGEIPHWRQMISEEDPSKLVNRPPVVTILGHVDHGKTTLLDAIRNTHVADREAGGITQHIGAYQIEAKDQKITFLDTPGHAAFTAMRARGAQGADIVILVVAANDGVMPQTKEAIAHAKAAQVPTIVALNKIDRPDANVDFTKNQLAEAGMVPDEWDGDTMVIPVSAKTGDGIDDLLEAVLLVAETNGIQANPDGTVLGTVIEAEIAKAKGVVATLLVQNGTLKLGDIIAAGTTNGHIRAMFNDRGKAIKKAGPATPVQIMGLNGVPKAGDRFQVFDNDKEARAFTLNLKNAAKIKKQSAPRATLEELFLKVQAGEEKELRLIINADVQGSLEPIINSISDLGANSEISVNILRSATGDITESDVMLATASKAIIIGFNVKVDNAAKAQAASERISIRLYSIIYRLLEDLEKALKGMLEPEMIETMVGHAEIRAVFNISKVGNIAGCRVIDGEIHRNAKVRITRDDEVVFTGELSSLKHEKDDVKEVKTGWDCGLAFKNFTEFAEGDTVECYTVHKASHF
ncbi:MAG: translation initiation factor IF-2 [Anaerolineaceae bacterium]|nr:translation initiation factor IF-2 [Anaerolineaceae bacterium]